MLSRWNRIARRTPALIAVAVAIALGHACSEDPTGGPDSDLAVPTNLTIEVLGVRRLRVQWDRVQGVSSYVIERRSNLTGPFTEVDQVTASSGNTAFYIDNDLEPETFYGYQVRSAGSLGARSEPSAIVGARTPAPPGIEVRVSVFAPDPAGADPNGFRLRVTGPQTVTQTIAGGVSALVSPL